MDYRDWRIISTLHREKSITRTAATLFISQPALSYRIRQIERQLGVELVQRGRQGVKFTEKGEFVAVYAEEMLFKLQALKDALQNAEDDVQGMLRLGVTRTFAMYDLPVILKKFCDFYPSVNYFITIDHSRNLLQAITQNELHVAIIRGNFHFPYERRTILQDNICVISNRRYEMKDLPEMPYISGIFESNLKAIINKWWNERFNKPPNQFITVNNTDIAKKLVLHGFGFTIAPMTSREDDGLLCKTAMCNAEGTPVTWDTSLVYRKENMDLSAVKAFVHSALCIYEQM